jgi:hypothetical protein
MRRLLSRRRPRLTFRENRLRRQGRNLDGENGCRCTHSDGRLASSAGAEECTQQNLVGTWRLVSVQVDGKIEPPDSKTHLVLLTPTHFVGVDYDSSGTVTTAVGGTLVISDSNIRSVVEFRFGEEQPRPKEVGFRGSIWKVHAGSQVATLRLIGRLSTLVHSCRMKSERIHACNSTSPGSAILRRRNYRGGWLSVGRRA